MNKMVFELQPDIIVNNRNKLQSDFSTPEQRIVAETGGRAWESCMIVRNLISCARDGGNYLLNIGPKPDGSIPEESVKVLTEVGNWMQTNGHTIYQPIYARYVDRTTQALRASATHFTCTFISG